MTRSMIGPSGSTARRVRPHAVKYQSLPSAWALAASVDLRMTPATIKKHQPDWFYRTTRVVHACVETGRIDLADRWCLGMDAIRDGYYQQYTALTADLEVAEQHADGAEDVSQTMYGFAPTDANWKQRRVVILRALHALRCQLAAGDAQHGVGR